MELDKHNSARVKPAPLNPAPGNAHYDSEQPPWLSSPMLWITVVSLAVAVSATVAIVILLACVRRRGGGARYAAVDSRAASLTPISTTSSADSPSSVLDVVIDCEKQHGQSLH